MRRGRFAVPAVVGAMSMAVLVACGSDGGASTARDVSVQATDPGDFTLRWTGAPDAAVYASTSASDPAASGTQVAEVADGAATVTGLDPVDRWYFTVRGEGGPSPVTSTRRFVLDGADNVRDMGGFTTADGRTTVWGKAFRGDGLSKLTTDDDRALADADVTTVVSFLGDSEIAKSGPDRLPDSATLVHIPVLDENTQALATALEGALADGDPAQMQELLGDGKASKLGDEGFLHQLQNPDTMAGYGRTLALLADSDGALLYHCSSGKDRTGMMSALLLGVLGVPDDAIVRDFVASNDYNRVHNEQTYAYLSGKGIDIDLVRPLMEQRHSEIEPVLDAVRDTYGGWDDFAHDVLGLDDATLEKLRATMLV